MWLLWHRRSVTALAMMASVQWLAHILCCGNTGKEENSITNRTAIGLNITISSLNALNKRLLLGLFLA